MLTMYGCAITPSQKERAEDLKNFYADRAQKTASNYGYDLCADKGSYVYSYWQVDGEAKVSCGRWDFYTSFYKMKYSEDDETFKTRLAIELDEKVMGLETEFMCIESSGFKNVGNVESGDYYPFHTYLVELRNRSSYDGSAELCRVFIEDYKFAQQIDDSQKKCGQMGFSLDTPEMANCILQLVANDSSATVVVEGGSSDSAIAYELRKMNNRGNKIYYENMMQRGMDILNCTTWPNC